MAMTSTTPSTKLSICFISLNVKLLALVKVQIHQTLDLAEIVILLQHNEPKYDISAWRNVHIQCLTMSKM